MSIADSVFTKVMVGEVPAKLLNKGSKLCEYAVDTFKLASPRTQAYKGMITLKPTPARKALQTADGVLRGGAKVTMELPADTFLRNVPEKQRKAVANLLGNPETVLFRAKHNKKGRFSIVGFQAKKGDKVVGNGALSITNFGEKDAVAKWRISSGKKGKNLVANGFADCAQNAEQVSVVPSYINKMLGLDAKAGKAAASHIKIDGSKGLKLLPEGTLPNIGDMFKFNPNKIMEIIRKNIGSLY